MSPKALGKGSGQRCRHSLPRVRDLTLLAKNVADGAQATPSQPLHGRQFCREPGLSALGKRLPTAQGAPLRRATTLWRGHAPYSRQSFQKTSHFFTSNFFLLNIHSYKYMFKIGDILSLFAIFNNFTSFYVIFSYTSDMNCKCMKSQSKFIQKMIFMFISNTMYMKRS
jgi:hypothetical protein